MCIWGYYSKKKLGRVGRFFFVFFNKCGLFCKRHLSRYDYILMFWNKFVYVIFLTSTGGNSPCTGPPVNVPIQRTAHLFSVIPVNDTKESMFGHQNVSSPVAGIKPNNLAAEASMRANH